MTITGESAGGGIVEQNTIAYGGAKENDLFIQGIAQSPAPLIIDPVIARMGANMFLQNAGVRSVDEARKLPSDVLVKAQSAAQMTAGEYKLPSPIFFRDGSVRSKSYSGKVPCARPGAHSKWNVCLVRPRKRKANTHVQYRLFDPVLRSHN